MATQIRTETRTTERSGAGAATEQPVGAGAVTNHNGHGTPVGVGVDLHLNAQDINNAVGSAPAASKQAVEKLNGYLKPEVQRAKVRRAAPGTETFVVAMAGVQEKFGPKLGLLNTDPLRMKAQVEVAGAAKEAAGPVAGLATQLGRVSNISLDAAHRDARAIYRRASVVALADPDLAQAIAPFAAAGSKIARKGVATRRSKAKAAQAGQPAPQVMPVETGSTTSTTVTTSQK